MAAGQHTRNQPRLTHSGLINQVPSLQCPICYKFMTEPKLLSCGHTFCLTCLSKIVLKNELRCALCRTVTEITNGNAATLPSNLAFKSVVDEVANLEGRCDVCDTMGKPDTIAYCQDCNLFMCQDCFLKHQGSSENQNHSLKKKRRSKHFTSLSMGKNFCSLHEKQTCEGICAKCNVYVCKECSVTHKNDGHEIQDLLQYIVSLNVAATPLKNDIRQVKDVSKTGVQQYQYREKKAIEHIDSVILQINGEYQVTMRALEEKRLSKIKACSDLKERICKVSEDLIDQLKKCNSLLDQTNYSIQGVLDCPFGDITTHTRTLKSSQSQINALKREINHITENPPNCFEDGDMLNCQKKYECEDYDVVELNNHVWEQTSIPLAQPEKEMACVTVDCQGKVVVGYFSGGVEVFTGTGSEGVSLDSLKEVQVMAMSFGNDGNLVLRNIDNEISIYGRTLNRHDAKFQTIDHIEGGDGDLALDTNNDIYASYRTIKVIHIYRKQGGKARQEIKCDGFIPQQILVMSTFDIIVMDGATIRVIDESGASKSRIVRKGYLGYPAVAWDGTLIIAWVKPEGRSVELVKYTQDMKNKKTLYLDNTIDLSGRQWNYCRVVDVDKIVFCCPKQVQIFSLNIGPYSSQLREGDHDDKKITISRDSSEGFRVHYA